MTAKELNIFKRYLKERGIFFEYFREAKKDFRAKELKKRLLSKNVPPTEAIMCTIHWIDTKIGSGFGQMNIQNIKIFITNF